MDFLEKKKFVKAEYGYRWNIFPRKLLLFKQLLQSIYPIVSLSYEK